MKSRKAYFDQWKEANPDHRERENQSRRERLASDPEYAARVRKQKREWAKKNREARKGKS